MKFKYSESGKRLPSDEIIVIKSLINDLKRQRDHVIEQQSMYDVMENSPEIFDQKEWLKGSKINHSLLTSINALIDMYGKRCQRLRELDKIKCLKIAGINEKFINHCSDKLLKRDLSWIKL